MNQTTRDFCTKPSEAPLYRSNAYQSTAKWKDLICITCLSSMNDTTTLWLKPNSDPPLLLHPKESLTELISYQYDPFHKRIPYGHNSTSGPINYPPHTYTSTSFLHNFSSSKAIYYHLLRKALLKYSYLWTPIPYLKRYHTLSCIHGSVMHTWCLHQIPQVGQVILCHQKRGKKGITLYRSHRMILKLQWRSLD